MKLNELNDEQLIEKLEQFSDRIDTIKEYIEDTSDSDVSFHLQTQLSNYYDTIKIIRSEIENRKTLKSIDVDRDILDDVLARLKSTILKKLKPELPYAGNDYRKIHSAQNIQTIIDDLKLNSLRYHQFGVLNEKLLKIIPDEILLEYKIYINKKDIVQETGSGLYFNSHSKHYNNSVSSHFGNCISEHFDNSVSEHLDDSYSKHTDNCRSWHYNNTRSHHSGNSKSHHTNNSTFEGVKIEL